MIKLSEILSEMPIGTYTTIGDFTKSKSFGDKRDRELVTHPVAIQKVKDFFKNTSGDFDFYFVNLQGRRRFAERGKVDEKFLFSPYPEGLGITPNQLSNGRINHDNITVFFVGNSASEKVPMTSWTIAHRFGHAIRFEYGFKTYVEWLNGEFNKILQLYNVRNKDSYGFGDRQFQVSKANLYNQIGTMKSAREGKIDRYVEFYYELFAQYLKTGGIKLNPLNDRIKLYKNGISTTSDIDYVNQILSEIERDFHFYAEDAINDNCGKIFIM